jgi:DNA-binding NtrC family response regulator
MTPQALLLEDDAPSLQAMEKLVRSHGFETIAVSTLKDARAQMAAHAPDLAILDLDLPDGKGTDLLDELDSGFETEVIVVTGHGSIDSAVDALHWGVIEYLTKPLDIKRFDRVLTGVKRTMALNQEVSELRENLRRLGRFDRLVGGSRAMQRVYDLVSRVARTSSTVLITGETGTGKDLVAESVHRLSRRSTKPFVPVNCGAIQPTLIESELFGHEQGSFTGAAKARKGLFEQASGGTLFLDEITEMPLDLQVKLLRVLENRTITRVGGEKQIAVDVRLLAATNRSPERAVEDGKLREDLFYRLKVFPITVPPLREREDDIELLATYFLNLLNEEAEETKRFESDAFVRLREHSWPGNVRELRNVVERAFILAADQITAEHVQVDRTDHGRGGERSELGVNVGMSIAEAEKSLILATLEGCGGDKKEASEVLGISLKTLNNRHTRYGRGRARTARA